METHRPGIPPKEGMMEMYPSSTQLPAATLAEGPRKKKEAGASTSRGPDDGRGWERSTVMGEEEKAVQSFGGRSEHSSLLLTSTFCLWGFSPTPCFSLSTGEISLLLSCLF